jgi:hypothetical protein
MHRSKMTKMTASKIPAGSLFQSTLMMKSIDAFSSRKRLPQPSNGAPTLTQASGPLMPLLRRAL